MTARNSLERVLAILEVFTEDRLEWTPDQLMEELGYKPVNRYLPQRPRSAGPAGEADAPATEQLDTAQLNPLLRWLDRAMQPPAAITDEPDASALQRATARVVGWLPIESQL